MVMESDFNNETSIPPITYSFIRTEVDLGECFLFLIIVTELLTSFILNRRKHKYFDEVSKHQGTSSSTISGKKLLIK
jgi:hypothetical protein